MAGEYKSPCGCTIHVAQWTSNRKVVSVKNCPMHKHAEDMVKLIRKTFRVPGSIQKMRDCQAEANRILDILDGVWPSDQQE